MHAHVTKVLIHSETKLAYGIEFYRDDAKHVIHATKEVILSGGSVNSPQLLMLSGVRPKKHLNELSIPLIQDLKVGHNLQDHIGFGGFTFMINQEVSLVQSRYETVSAVIRYATLRWTTYCIRGC